MPTLSEQSLDRAVSRFRERRATTDPPCKGVAPCVYSPVFRTDLSTQKPKARRWDHRLSREALRQQPSTLKGSSPPFGTISLGTARPAASAFPWLSLSSVASDAGDPRAESIESARKVSTSCHSGDEDFDLSVALNYGHSAGSYQLLRFITEHVEYIHNPQYDDWETCLTCGTTSAMDTVFRMLCNPGDTILTEEFVYPGTTEAVRPMGISVVGVEMDEFGLLPGELGLKLSAWDLSKGPKPTVLYTIPCGQNPTGTTQTLQRRREIYEVAERHDLIIVEDDPYYFLQLGESSTASPTGEKSPSIMDQYLANLPASYASLDTSGRVVRLDSVSKILAPGLRTGWLTAPTQLAQIFCSYADYGTTGPSGPSQVMLYKLLDQEWGHKGFLGWLSNLSKEYQHRMELFVGACKKYLPLSVCSWEVPPIGMFIWLRVKVPESLRAAQTRHNGAPEVEMLELESKIYLSARNNGVQISRGSWFSTDAKPSGELHFRLTFAAAQKDTLEEGAVRFGNVLKTELGLKGEKASEFVVPKDFCNATELSLSQSNAVAVEAN